MINKKLCIENNCPCLNGKTTADYVYHRKDGGTTFCYGEVREDSNFDIVCENENYDNVWTDNDSCRTWNQVCKYLENNYNPHIEQLEAV